MTNDQDQEKPATEAPANDNAEQQVIIPSLEERVRGFVDGLLWEAENTPQAGAAFFDVMTDLARGLTKIGLIAQVPSTSIMLYPAKKLVAIGRATPSLDPAVELTDDLHAVFSMCNFPQLEPHLPDAALLYRTAADELIEHGRELLAEYAEESAG